VSLPVEYKSVKLDCGYRLDLVVQDSVVLELKCVEHILPVHEAQLLRISSWPANASAYSLNFNVATLVRGGSEKGVMRFFWFSPCLRVSVVKMPEPVKLVECPAMPGKGSKGKSLPS